MAISVNMFEAAIDNRRPAALKERPSAPEHHRSRKQKLKPVKELGEKQYVGAAGRESCRTWREKRSARQHHADPETPRHVDQLGIASSSNVTVRGSSAMPHIGQEPGSERTISGCIGQTYSVFTVGADGAAGSRAMPHLGQAPASTRAPRGPSDRHRFPARFYLIDDCAQPRVRAHAPLAGDFRNFSGSSLNFARQ